MKNFLSIKDLSKEEIYDILDFAKEIEKHPKPNILDGKIIGSLFFEPSTRTRMSFISAAYRVGAKVLGFDSPDASSIKKGESLRDTIKMVEVYTDAIVMRHSIEGAAKFAAEISRVPILNAGDGANEHPSQTLLDLYTIREQFGTLENLKIAFVGDMKYGRTVHSLAKALSDFGCEFYFVAPDIIQIPSHILQELDNKKISYKLISEYSDILNIIDIMYMTRIQKERFDNLEEFNQVSGIYKISKDKIVDKCKDDMIILHPLPRVDEISVDLDDTKYALYFKQAANGIPIRSALFAYALGVKKFDSYRSENNNKIISYKTSKCNNIMCVTNFEKTENKVVNTSYGNFCYYCGKEII
ncbi:MAG: aspartate carbamoyltransferase [Fusobacteriaceae bacterium]|jgi:aspartate carbamoyltransferase catalytic subunit|nr:aspartate carbamoyltransferase [Fusobacteriaceae bacterium]